METKTSQSVMQGEAEVWSAIAAFEEIVEAIPNDRVALETLYEAYDKIGDRARAVTYLVRLADAVADEEDREAAASLLQPLRDMQQDAPSVPHALLRIEALTLNSGQAPAAVPTRKKKLDITAELSLAYNLMQAGELSQDEYAEVVRDLSDCSSKNLEVPVSVLHVLADRQSKKIDKVLVFLSKQTSTPILALSRFEPQPKLFGLLPREYMTQHGAIVFDRLDTDYLVAILNPYDQPLRRDVREALKSPCHFFLVSATHYDAALEAIRTTVGTAAASRPR